MGGQSSRHGATDGGSACLQRDKDVRKYCKWGLYIRLKLSTPNAGEGAINVGHSKTYLCTASAAAGAWGMIMWPRATA